MAVQWSRMILRSSVVSPKACAPLGSIIPATTALNTGNAA